MSRFDPKFRWWSATSRTLSRFAPARRPHARRRLRLECLEDRTLLTTVALTVSTLADDPSGRIAGQTTLRDVITRADADTADQYSISFSVTGTIDLTSPLPDLDNNINLEGPGASDLTVQRDSSASAFSVFTVDSGVTVILSGMTIAGGDAGSANGGGVCNGGTLTLTDCTVSGNSVTEASTGGGGGIYNDGMLTVTNSTFSANTVTATSNIAGGSDYEYGGGLYNVGTATVTDSTISNNSASDGGGVGNGGYGGGLYNVGMLTVVNSTFTGNSVTQGGGGLFNAGAATLTNCTVGFNVASYDGGGIFTGAENGVGDVGDLTLNNTIVAGNGAPTNPDLYGTYTGSYNLIGGNPLLGPLADNGGPTQTMALLPGSPAIDAGSNALAVDANGNPLTTDQRGLPRVVGTAVDIGAFESQGFTLTPVTGSTPQGTPVNSPFVNPLAVNVTANNPLEPVAGGVVTFSVLASGASASLSTSGQVIIGSNGLASVTAIANAIGGQYTVSASTAGAATPASFVLTNQLSPPSQTINFGPIANQTYGVAPITLSATANSSLPVSFSVISGPATLSGNVLTVTGAGTVEVEASQLGNATYIAAVPVDESFTVEPAPLTVTALGESMTYGGTIPALTYTFTGLVNGDTSATFSGNPVTTATSSSIIGEYPITQGTLAATGNYTIGTFDPGTLTVNPAPLMVTAVNGSMTYGGTVPALTYTYTGLVNGDSDTLFLGGLATTATSSSSVGGYPITVGTLYTIGNYIIRTFEPGTLSVNPAKLTIMANNDSKTYGTLKTFSSTAFKETGLVTTNGDTITAVTESSSGAAAAATIGTYNIVPSAATGTGLSNYTISYVNGALRVNPAPLTVTAVSGSMTYGGRVPALTYTYSGLLKGDSSATFSGGLATSATSSSSVGDYPINVGTLAATGNYTIGTFDPGTLSVNPATLTITANNDSKTYGTLKTFSSTAFKETGLLTTNGDIITAVTESSTGVAAAATVGTYKIVPSAATGTGLGNYTISYVNGTLAVNPATLTITANNDSKTYGTLKTFSTTAFKEAGLLTTNGDIITAVTETSTGAASAAATVGTYKIVPSAAIGTGLSNYTISYVNGTLTVNPAPLTITANNDSKTYGTLRTFSSTAFKETGLLTTNGDTITAVTESSTGAATAATVGTYVIVPGGATGRGMGNYAISYVNGTLTVNPAPLMVTAVNGSMTYGGTVPALTYTYTGLVKGDSSATFSGGLATSATSSSSVGGYPITVGTLAATGNYTIGTFHPGTLSVNPAKLTITANNDSKTYGTLKTFGSTAFKETGLVTTNGDNITGVTESSTGATAATTVGTYKIVPSAATGKGLSNYIISYVDGTLTVNPATPTFSWSNPAPIAYFMPLSGTLLDAVASWTVGGTAVSVVGTFAYTPPAGTLLPAGTQTLSARFTPSDRTDYTSATATVQIVVLGPGVTAIGSQLYCVGGSSTNDQVQVKPVGNSNTGSTGLNVQASLNGVNSQIAYTQSFTGFNVFLQGGNENIVLANSLTINTAVNAGNGDDDVQLGNGNNIVTLGNGNDIIGAGSGSNTVMAGDGNDNVQISNGNNNVIVGNGNDNLQLGNGNDNVTVGNGNDKVSAGNGSDVIVEGNGNDYVSAGNGADLVVGGLGQHTILLGNGNDILIDGSATVVKPGDSLRQILSDWNASSSASVDTRLRVVDNTTHSNVLTAGSGRDWWFYTYSKDVTNKKSTDRLN
jgi:mucin-19